MRKITLPVLLVLMLFLLCACNKHQPAAPADAAVQESGSDIAAEQAQAESPLAETPEIQITEPVYVYLPDDRDTSDTLVFREWVTGEEGTNEPLAKYQDVSGIENAISIPSAYGTVGETITMPLRICGQVDLCAFDLRITYDTSKLKYDGCLNEDDDLIVNCNESTGVIFMNFLRVKNLEGGLDCCDLQFIAKTSEACDTTLQIEVVQAVSLDHDEVVFCHFSTVDGIAHLNKESE